MLVGCIQFCFIFHSHSYLPFPCLGLGLNFKSRYFPQHCSYVFFFCQRQCCTAWILRAFIRLLWMWFQPPGLRLPHTLLTGCVNIPWAAAPILWIDKHSWLGNLIFNSRLEDIHEITVHILYFTNWHIFFFQSWHVSVSVEQHTTFLF